MPARAASAARPRAVVRASNPLDQAGDAARLQVIPIPSDGERHVGAPCEELGGMNQAALSRHLALLRHAHLLAPRRTGKNNFYGLTEAGLEPAAAKAAMPG